MSTTCTTNLLRAVTTTGDGDIFNALLAPLAASIQAEITGAPAVCVINLMGMISGGTWDTLAVLDVTQGYISGEVQPLALPTGVVQFKGNVSALSGGATVTLHLATRG